MGTFNMTIQFPMLVVRFLGSGMGVLLAVGFHKLMNQAVENINHGYQLILQAMFGASLTALTVYCMIERQIASELLCDPLPSPPRETRALGSEESNAGGHQSQQVGMESLTNHQKHVLQHVSPTAAIQSLKSLECCANNDIVTEDIRRVIEEMPPIVHGQQPHTAVIPSQPDSNSAKKRKNNKQRRV